jgi:hypothetical protein
MIKNSFPGVLGITMLQDLRVTRKSYDHINISDSEIPPAKARRAPS